VSIGNFISTPTAAASSYLGDGSGALGTFGCELFC
jgi:hypothetical protein